MSDERLVHVSAEGVTEEEANEIQDTLEESLKTYGIEACVVVTDERTDVTEVPALDEYIEEIADRVAEKMMPMHGYLPSSDEGVEIDGGGYYQGEGAWHGVLTPDGEPVSPVRMEENE